MPKKLTRRRFGFDANGRRGSKGGNGEIRTRPRELGDIVQARNSLPSLINFSDHVETTALPYRGGQTQPSLLSSQAGMDCSECWSVGNSLQVLSFSVALGP